MVTRLREVQTGGADASRAGAGREGRGRGARKAVGLKAMVVGFEDRTDASINVNSRPAGWNLASHTSCWRRAFWPR